MLVSVFCAIPIFDARRVLFEPYRSRMMSTLCSISFIAIFVFVFSLFFNDKNCFIGIFGTDMVYLR